MSKGGRQKGGHTPKISEHKDNDDDTNRAGGQQADDTPGGSQQSVHDPGKKEIEELKQKMAGQEDKVEKMTEDPGKLRNKMEELIGLKEELANHKEAIKTVTNQIKELEKEGKTLREDVTNEIKRLREERTEDFDKLEQRIMENLKNLEHRMEEKVQSSNLRLAGFIILVLAVMLGVVFTMCKGPSVSPNPGPDSTCEEKIQALDSRLKQDFENFKGNVDTKISDFRHKEFSPLTDRIEEFKKNQNQAFDDMKDHVTNSLEQSRTKVEKDQEVFEENLQTSIQKMQTEERKKFEDEVNLKIDGKSENLTRHVVTVVFEHEEFVKVVSASMILNETVRSHVEETNELTNKQNKLDERLKKTELTLSASINSAKDKCMEEIQKTGQSLTNSVAKFEIEIGSVRDLVKNAKETLMGQIGSVDTELDTLHATMTKNFTSFNTQMESFQQTLKTSSKETEGKLENVQKEFDHWKKKVKTSEGKINFLDEKGQDTNTMIILVVIIIVFIVVLVVMLMLRQRNTAAPGPINISPGLRGGYEPSAILKNVKDNCVKDNTVCVLHFNKESKDFCVNLTKVVESDSHKRKPYFLDNHNDILTIPRSKVIIVYVEKNQRNIILEDPDQELGDLRRTTVEAALKMGATVVVVYMHHEESRYLGNNELYCPKLQSVTRHYVLSKLEKQDGVYSVFDSYSDFQRQHLKKLISDSFIKK